MEVKIKRVEISPEIAAEYLKKNFSDNRNVRNATVELYASDMTLGQWSDTGETIKFDEYGNLIDGQHRLLAVIKSGKTISFHIASGIEAKATVNVDIGIRRTAADALKVTGLQENLQAKGTLAKRILLHEAGAATLTSTIVSGGKALSGSRKVITVSQIVDYVQAHELGMYCTQGQRLYQIQISNILSPSDWIFLSWLLEKTDVKNSSAFLEKLATLDGISGSSPIKSLFKKLQDRMSGAQKMVEIMAAFNAFCAGRSNYRITHKQGIRI
jgi:hypothetical protein